jgi:hypothetical protein
MNPAETIRGVILKLHRKHSKLKPSLHLSMPPVLSEFRWNDKNFEKLIEKFICHVMTISRSAKSVQIVVHEVRKKADLENFFSIFPSYWLHLGFESQAETGFESGAKRILEDLGFRCSEWVGVEESDSQLGAFHLGAQDSPALILFMQNHGARRNCDFLIPVVDSIPQLAQANCV